MRIESLQEGARLAVEQLRANKFRAALTILGIVVGVGSVMAMSALVSGIRTSIMSEMEAIGPKNFMVTRFDWTQLSTSDEQWQEWMRNPKVTVSEARLVAKLPTVRAAISGFDQTLPFDIAGQPTRDVQVYARDAGWSQFTTGTFVAGHDFLHADVRASAPVVVITKHLAQELFGGLDPIGRRVHIQGKPFRVIGVFQESRNVFANIIKNWAVMPTTSAVKHLDVWDGAMAIFIVTAPEASQNQAMDQVIGALRTTRGLRPSEPNNFFVLRQQELVRTFNRITNVFFVVMLALSSVALMVGGVGVIAIMMIAVTERTREIGIRKAMGATRREILWQFLVEAATLTLIGGALGLLLGGGVALLVHATTPIPARAPATAIAAALGMAAIAGVLFGIWPAWRAARMDPVVALRYE
ncbi:MAG: ABC transporter permease [Gemmatimonadetes bacterium]|nr:ABC transporter permease [Gemmatimonadota bacterium]